MATTASPYGFRPINLIGGLPYAGSTRQFKMNPSGYASNIFYGSVVALDADGYLTLVTNVGSNADAFPVGVVGVFVGCQYTNPTTKQLTFSQYYPANVAASDIYAFVVDDPNALFQVQANGAVTQEDLGQNVFLANAQSTSTGSTTTGNSNIAVSSNTADTSTIAFRIVDFVNSTTSTVGDAYTDLIVKFNAGIHSYTRGTGV